MNLDEVNVREFRYAENLTADDLVNNGRPSATSGCGIR
jgi:hypothetical protein